jgi:3-phosphoshikimate 1-carboxyvinyltransferase
MDKTLIDAAPASGLVARMGGPLIGEALVPGDKSISHRALMIGALAIGETHITGLLEGEDVLRTATAMRQLGARVERDGASWRVAGRGVGGLAEPDDVLDLGNSGTSTRLLMGLVATHHMVAMFTGDRSLRSRPMARVTTPLTSMGARVVAREGGRLPLALTGTGDPLPIAYRLPVASAQVKSAILLAGLNAPGETTVIETAPTRDHSELMLTHFGASIRVSAVEGGSAVAVVGRPELVARDVFVPRDPSSAAFALVAAAIVPGSRVRLPGIGLNPRRTGLFDTLIEMGASIAIDNRRIEAGEPVGDLAIEAGALSAVEVPSSRAPSMIDEYPILAMAAACARGRTVMRGLEELRVKESDRLAAIVEGLMRCGVEVEVSGNDLAVNGTGRPPRGEATIATRLDHRIAMAFLVLGLACEKPVTIDDAAPIATSFPSFLPLMRGLGALIAPTAR